MYKSEYTEFIAYEPPYVDKIYYKKMNKTILIIHVENDWSMYAEVIHPFELLVPKFSLNQVECEQLILNKLPSWRPDVKKSSGLEQYDSAMLMYICRGINLINDCWFAWSEDDKIEDYHPRYNKELADIRWKADREAEDYYTFETDPIRKTEAEKEAEKDKEKEFNFEKENFNFEFNE